MKVNFLALLLLLLISSCKSVVVDNSIILESINFSNTSSRDWEEGWLVVPENRTVSVSNNIKLPFIYSKKSDSISNNYAPVLIMSGGPGNGSLHMANGVIYAPWGKERDVIVLDQRGTHHAKPFLDCPEIDSFRIQGLKNGLWGVSLDSLKMIGVSDCYDRLVAQGIDLNGYNTLESVEDLETLRTALQIDKWILYGMSYSCNLMAAYAQTYPENVTALILDSPLPHHVNYDEDAYSNIDSILIRTIQEYTGSLEIYDSWKKYIDSIEGSYFEIIIDSTTFRYGKNELIDILLTKMSDHSQLSETVESIQKIIQGNHEEVSNIIKGNLKPALRKALGMRYSLWLSEELPEESLGNVEKGGIIYPWLKAYPANDVSFKTANHWKVNSIYKKRTWPSATFNGPALVLSGQLDPWTPDWYGAKMLEVLPKGQQLIYKRHTHLPGFTNKGMKDIHQFLLEIR